MTDTGHLPRIDAEPEPEPWTPDPHRWGRWHPVRVVAGVELVAFGAGWVLTGDWIGGLVAASFTAAPVLALVFARTLPAILNRLDALDGQVSRAERDRAALAVSVADVSGRQRNHELDCGRRDELAPRRERKGQG